MLTLSHLTPEFYAAMREACEAALDAGVFYEMEVKAFVLPRIRHLDTAVETAAETIDEPKDWDERRAIVERVKSLPRGHAIIVRRSSGYYETKMSAGGGESSGLSDSHTAPVPWEKTYIRMIGYEIYLMRNLVERERAIAANFAAIQTRGFTQGDKFKNLRINGATYSSVSIETVETGGDGYVALTMKKRSSANVWKCRIEARILVRIVDEANVKKLETAQPLKISLAIGSKIP